MPAKNVDSSKKLSSLIDADTAMMLFLPHLTPKEAAPLIASCKLFWRSSRAVNTLDAKTFAARWIHHYDQIFASPEYASEAVGKLMVKHYTRAVLLDLTIVASQHQYRIAQDDSSSLNVLCKCERRINFYQTKNSKAIAPVCSFLWYGENLL